MDNYTCTYIIGFSPSKDLRWVVRDLSVCAEAEASLNEGYIFSHFEMFLYGDPQPPTNTDVKETTNKRVKPQNNEVISGMVSLGCQPLF